MTKIYLKPLLPGPLKQWCNTTPYFSDKNQPRYFLLYTTHYCAYNRIIKHAIKRNAMPKRVDYNTFPPHIVLEKRSTAYKKLESHLQDITVHATEMLYYFSHDREIITTFLKELNSAIHKSGIRIQRNLITNELALTILNDP